MANEPQTPRMFKNSFMEWGSRCPPYLPLVAYLPLIAWGGYFAFVVAQVSWLPFVGLLISGLFVWSLTEYLLHRFGFHHMARSSWGKRICYIMHGMHHDYPQDFNRLVMPLAVTIPFAILLCPVAYVLFGAVSWGFGAGFGLGYLYYDFTHFCTHRRKGFCGFKFQRRNHLSHHFKEPEYNYGVSSPLWDYIFGTIPQAALHQSSSLHTR